MTLDLYDFGDGGRQATKWQRQHAARKRQAQAKKHRAEAAANKKKAMREARADLKKRRAKWLIGHKRKCAAAKAAGLPKPGTQGKPWRLGLEHSQVIDMTGWTFGRLTVVRSAPISLTMRTAQRCRCWVVKCSCGTSGERIINGTSLRQGKSICCGCTKRERMAARRKEKGPRPTLSVKLLLEAQRQREAGNVRVARLLELSAPAVRTSERKRARRQRKGRRNKQRLH